MLLLDMAYRLLREFRQAFTRLDTPPFTNRRHPGSDIALLTQAEGRLRLPGFAADRLRAWKLRCGEDGLSVSFVGQLECRSTARPGQTRGPGSRRTAHHAPDRFFSGGTQENTAHKLRRRERLGRMNPGA